MPTIRSRFTLLVGLLTLASTATHFAQTAAPATPPTTPAVDPTATATRPAPPSPRPVNAIAGANSSEMVNAVNFGSVDIDGALQMLERWSGKTVFRPAGLPAVSLAFSIPRVTKAEAIQALETVLTMNGIAITPLGDKFLKATPLNTARTEAPEFIDGSTLGLPPSGHIAAKLFQLKFLRVSEFAPQISGLLNPAAGSAPVLFEKSNAALITDSISNLQRIEMLLNQVDQPSLGGMKPKFYKVQSTTASELVAKLQGILSGSAATSLGTATSFQADDRTNQIILLSDERQHEFFDNLIEKLDTAGESSTRQEVIALKHANATELGSILTSVISGQAAVTRTGAQGNQNQAGIRNAIAGFMANRNNAGGNNNNPNQPVAMQAAALAGGAQGNAGNNNQNRQANRAANAGGPISVTTGPNGNLIINQGGGSAPQQFSEILTVIPDERSNSLVVSGTVDDMRLIKDLIHQLDVLLAQVRIEVVIAEVTLSDQATTGIDALGLVIQNDKLVAFSASGPGFDTGTTPATLVDSTTGLKSLSGTLNLKSTPRKSNINILSAPNIVTSHNKQGFLFVGEERPIISSYVTNNGNNGGGNVTGIGNTSINYTDIGITLTVTPLIGPDGSVQLEIEQEVKDVLDSVLIDGNSQPVIGSRKATSFVSSKSGEIVVLGGMQRKTISRTSSRLGGIPIIGDILGSRRRENTRTDLVIFLRPYVLTNTPADNVEAMRRLETSPQKKDVEATLQGVLPVKSK
ncbi:secretin N-terminal domain-containing protein [Oleiharenicola lentus]|uniref:secretin N-terminal domain-containing protein n=1 Tax=Oleiharenicola lentus TaxID=2508720 RepID=UPI003F67BEA3